MTTMDRVIRTLNLKLAKYREKEKETEEALQKCAEQRDHHKSLQMNYWVRLHSLTDKFSAMSLDKDRLLRTLEEKANMEEDLWARVQSSVQQAEQASMEAVELQRKVQEFYLPERQKLLDAEEETKKLKIALKRAQNDLRIAKLPEKLNPKDAMVFNRHPSNKSLEEKSAKCSPASCSASATGPQRSSCSTPMEEKTKSCSLCKTAAEVDAKLRKARILEQQVRDTQRGWGQERQELLESIEFEKTEKNKLNHRLGMLRERNKQMQVTFDKQKKEYETAINQLKIALRERKQENRTIFEMWKQTFEDDPSPLSRNIKKLIREFKEPTESSEEYKYLNVDNPQPVPLPTPYEMFDDTVTTTTSTSPNGAHHHTGGGGSNPHSSAGSHSPDRLPNGAQTFYKNSSKHANPSTAVAEASYTGIPPSYTAIPSFLPDNTGLGLTGMVDSRLASIRCPPQPTQSVRDPQGKTSPPGAGPGLQAPPPPITTTTKTSTTHCCTSSSSSCCVPLSPPRTLNALLKQSLARTHLVTDQERDAIESAQTSSSSTAIDALLPSSKWTHVGRNGVGSGSGSPLSVTIKDNPPPPPIADVDVDIHMTLPRVKEENENANETDEEKGEYGTRICQGESDDPAGSYHSYVLTHPRAYGQQAGGDNNNNNNNSSSSNINTRNNMNMNINDVQKEGKGESQQNMSMNITDTESSGLSRNSRGGECKQYYNFGEASNELQEYEDMNDNSEEVGVDINSRRSLRGGGTTTALGMKELTASGDINDINDMMIRGMGPMDQLHMNSSSLGQGWFVEDEEEEEEENETEVYRTKYQPPLSPVIESPIRTCPEPEHENTTSSFANMGEGEFFVAPQQQRDSDDNNEFNIGEGECGSHPLGGEGNPFDMLQHDGKTDDQGRSPLDATHDRRSCTDAAASKDEGPEKYSPIYSSHEGHLDGVNYIKGAEFRMPNVMNSIKNYDDLLELNGSNSMALTAQKMKKTRNNDDENDEEEKKRGNDGHVVASFQAKGYQVGTSGALASDSPTLTL